MQLLALSIPIELVFAELRAPKQNEIILLKNEKEALPLKSPKSIAVFGNDAADAPEGPYNFANYEYGTLASAGGSGTGHFTHLISPLTALRERAAKDGALVMSITNNKVLAGQEVEERWGTWNPYTPDVCLVFIQEWHEELFERPSLDVDWQGDKVVKMCGGINMLPWTDHPNITAILVAHYPGQESVYAITDVLYGDVNPSAKLPYTIAYNASEYVSLPTTSVNTTGPDDWQSYFNEKLEIDYRHFDAANKSVRFEFGFGLSYTTFNLSGIRCEPAAEGSFSTAPEDQPTAPGGNPALFDTLYKITVSIKNFGDVNGAAVAQLYVSYPDGAPEGTPPNQLRGFDKVFLAAG